MVLNQFFEVSDKIPQLLLFLIANQVSETENFGFSEEISLFQEDMKRIAKQSAADQSKGEQFIFDLAGLIKNRISLLNLSSTVKRFIDEVYKKEFFSKVVIQNSDFKSKSELEFVMKQPSVIPKMIEGDLLLMNPSIVISEINTQSSPLKQQSVRQITEEYSIFIDKNFVELKNSNLKDLISQQIIDVILK